MSPGKEGGRVCFLRASDAGCPADLVRSIISLRLTHLLSVYELESHHLGSDIHALTEGVSEYRALSRHPHALSTS